MVLKGVLKIHMHLLSLYSTTVIYLFESMFVLYDLNLRPSQLSSHEMAFPVLNKFYKAEDKVIEHHTMRQVRLEPEISLSQVTRTQLVCHSLAFSR